jgi:hypothetical protein
MRWIIFTGTWCLTNKEVEEDVREAARAVFEHGDGLATGGATGVDYFAMDEWIKMDPECKRIRIFLPAKRQLFISDYRANWKRDPITDTEIDAIEAVLALIAEKNPAALLQARKDNGDVVQDDYDLRHDEEVTFSDEVYAFQVNNSTGTQDTIDKAVKAGLPLALHKKYTI